MTLFKPEYLFSVFFSFLSQASQCQERVHFPLHLDGWNLLEAILAGKIWNEFMLKATVLLQMTNGIKADTSIQTTNTQQCCRNGSVHLKMILETTLRRLVKFFHFISFKIWIPNCLDMFWHVPCMFALSLQYDFPRQFYPDASTGEETELESTMPEEGNELSNLEELQVSDI